MLKDVYELQGDRLVMSKELSVGDVVVWAKNHGYAAITKDEVLEVLEDLVYYEEDLTRDNLEDILEEKFEVVVGEAYECEAHLRTEESA